MPFTFDHAIIAVNDLDAAIGHYEALGFTVIRGGEHASGTTHNALICFADGTYLELLAPTGRPRNPDSEATDFSHLLQHGEGFVGYALYTADLAAEIDKMRSHGIEISDPQPGRRTRRDGVELRWRSASINGSMSPFFIQDETPRHLRVPGDRQSTTHLNGVFRLTGVYILVENLADSTAYFRNMLNVRMETLGVQSSLYRYFKLDGVNVYLFEPNDAHTRRHRNQRGAAPYEIHLETAEDRSPLLTPDRLHNARIQIWAGIT